MRPLSRRLFAIFVLAASLVGVRAPYCRADAAPIRTLHGRISLAQPRPEFKSSSLSLPDEFCFSGHATTGDFDGNGCSDLIVTTCRGTRVLMADCQGGVRESVWTGLPEPGELERMRIADYNCDGLADFLLPDFVHLRWRVGISNGRDTFTIRESYPLSLPEKDRAVISGNLNGSECGTLLVQSFPDNLWFRLDGSPDGTIKRSENVFMPKPPMQMRALADADGDGRDEMVLSYRNGEPGDGFQNWLALGPTVGRQRVLAAFSKIAEWTRPSIGDFNGDGKIDILGYGGDLVGWWMGVSSERDTYEKPVVIPRKLAKLEYLTGDFNGDGLADLLWYSAIGGRELTVLTTKSGSGVSDGEILVDGTSVGKSGPDGSFSLEVTSDREHRIEVRRQGYSIRPIARITRVRSPLNFVAEPMRQGPAMCFAFQGDSHAKWGRVQSQCPDGYAYLELNNLGSWQWAVNKIPVSGTCCPLPSPDILTTESVTAEVRCPDDFVATGSEQEVACRNCVKKLRCTKINTTRYQLGPELPGVYWGPRVARRSSRPRLSRSDLPLALRFAFGRIDYASWDLSGCTGSPLGSLPVQVGRPTCTNYRFRELQYSGAQNGDPSAGTPVKMFPNCKKLENIFDPSTTCEE